MTAPPLDPPSDPRLFTGTLPDPGGPWYAVRVKHQFETTVALHLRNSGYETFLPLYRSRRRWSDREKILELPLFPGYVFCRLEANLLRPVYGIPGVNGIVSFGRAPAPADPAEIQALRTVVDSRMVARPWPFLKTGRKVQLESGPLRGLVGIVVRHKHDCRLVLSVSLLNSSVAVEIEEKWIRPLD